ncbi:MAG: hypothetical protein M1127_01130 [Patescibacteria group bacterium]|nr:hypothetical protein [Patescibacteria group bacterium]
MKKIVSIIYVLIAVSFIAFYGLIVNLFSTDFNGYFKDFLFFAALFIVPTVIPALTLYSLKVEYKKATEKRKNIYEILFLVLNSLTAVFYIFFLLLVNAISNWS